MGNYHSARKYLLDGQPVSSSELINSAAAVDGAFENDWLKQTSVAANILRDLGHVVEENPEYAE